MEINIDDKNYELRFGISFINAIDNIYTQEMSGVQFGMGLEMMQTYLDLKRPTVLFNIIRAGTSHLNSKPSGDGIEKYLEGVYIEGKQEELFDRVEEATEQAPFLKQALKGIKTQAKE